MGIAKKLRDLVGLPITKTQRVLNAESGIKEMRKYSNKLPSKGGVKKKPKKKASQ